MHRRVRHVLIIGKARRRVRRVSMMDEACRRDGAQDAQFSRLKKSLSKTQLAEKKLVFS